MRVAVPWLLLFIPLGAWYFSRMHAQSFVGPRRAMLTARLALFTVIVLALSRPEITLPSQRTELLVLADDSASMLPSRRQAITQIVHDLAATQPDLRVWRFGQTAQPSTIDHPLGDKPQNATRLERALFSASTAMSEGGARRIVLLSDGRETEGDARRAARALGEEHTPVYAVRLPPARDPEVLIAGMSTPEGLRRGEQVDVTVNVRSTLPTRTVLALSEGGRPLWEQMVSLKTGDNDVRAPITVPTSGLVRLRATITPTADTLRENNTWERTIYVEGPPRVLLGTASLDQPSALADALLLQGIDVVRFDLQLAPQSIEELSGFDAVVLDEIPISRIDRETQELFEAYVRDLGGGLLYITGHAGIGTFDHDSPLQRLLPVESEERVENQVPPVAMVLVIDRSGSMEGDKLAWAKRAALGTLEVLPPDAQLGLIAFDAEFRWIAPLKQVANRQQLAAEINAIDAGGGTRFFPALEEAYYTLGLSNAAVKHIVLLTDGLSTDGVDFRPLATKMAKAGISLSTVAMSKEADLPLLKMLAQVSGGRSYYTDKASEVPRIFGDESKLVTKKSEVERAFRPVVQSFFEPISHVDFALAPFLHGFVVTSLRAGAESILGVDKEHKQPLLARWRYGLGQVLAFTSDTDGAWAKDWVAWPEYPRLWAQIVRATMRDRTNSMLSVSGRVGEGALEVRIDLDDARARASSDIDFEAYAVDANLVAQKVPLEATGPGALRGRIPWSAGGAIVLRAKASQHGQVLASATHILDQPIGKEFALGDDEDTLSAVTQLSGGEMIDAADVPRLSSRTATRRVPLAPWLVALALALFFVDLYIKRVRPTVQRT
jgi:uncharacterized membrane protein